MSTPAKECHPFDSNTMLDFIYVVGGHFFCMCILGNVHCMDISFYTTILKGFGILSSSKPVSGQTKPLLRAHLHLHCRRASVPESLSEPLTEFCLHYIRGLDQRSSEAMAILVACSQRPHEPICDQNTLAGDCM